MREGKDDKSQSQLLYSQNQQKLSLVSIQHFFFIVVYVKWIRIACEIYLPNEKLFEKSKD